MKVRMKVGISGTRSGVEWPPPGQTLEVDDEEGMHLCAGGLAEPVAEPAKVWTATAPEPEQRDANEKRARPSTKKTTSDSTSTTKGDLP